VTAIREKTLYQLLQVDPTACPEVIDAAYGALAGKLHPERDSGDAMLHAELTGAYAVLRDPERRHAYDGQLTAAPAAPLVPVGPGPVAPIPSGTPSWRSSSLTERVEAHARGPVAAGDQQLEFGRYAGWTLKALAHQDPDYLRWLSRHSSGVRYRHVILDLLAEVDARASTAR
jgi:curved DNA-binding protein CbpA